MVGASASLALPGLRPAPLAIPARGATCMPRVHRAGKDATVNGMLDGFEALDPADVKSSVEFINRA